MTISESLRGLSSYPIPDRALNRITMLRSLEPSAEVTTATLKTKEYMLAEADVLVWLSNAPAVSEGDVRFSFSKIERESFANEAKVIYNKLGEGETQEVIEYGYVGDSI